MPALYFDSSALMKLLVTEEHSDAVETLATGGIMWLTSDLAQTELIRAITRRQPSSVEDARYVLHNLIIMALDRDLYDLAGRLQPARLRSLDAIHVAAALSLGADLTAMVTYDKQLAEAATLNGLQVLSPGVTLD